MKLIKTTIKKATVANVKYCLVVEIPTSFGFEEGEEIIVSIRKPQLQKGGKMSKHPHYRVMKYIACDYAGQRCEEFEDMDVTSSMKPPCKDCDFYKEKAQAQSSSED